MLLRWWTCGFCALLHGLPQAAGFASPASRRSAQAFSLRIDRMQLRAEPTDDSSDEPLLIASASIADDDLTARLAFDDLATRKVRHSCCNNDTECLD
jgi:hypothetical protein